MDSKNERPIIAKLREAIKAHGLTEEQVFQRYNKRHSKYFGDVESISEWSDNFVDWIIRGMPTVERVIKGE